MIKSYSKRWASWWTKIGMGLLLLSAPAAHASVTRMGTVSGFALLASGVALIFVDGNRPDIPGCSNPNFPSRWALDITTPTGQAFYSYLLTAHQSGEPISIYGTGSCSVLGDAETVTSVVTKTLNG